MKKSIFWNLKDKTLSVENLNGVQIALGQQEEGTTLSIENVHSTDLQLLKDALLLYYGVGKGFREVNTEIEKLHAGQKLVFDKQDETKKHNDKVIDQMQRVLTLMTSIPDSNKAMTQEVISLNRKLSMLVEESEQVKV